MKPRITLFPVDCGDMTLIELADSAETKILVDCNIRDAADDDEDDTRDVAADLRDRLKRDDKNRPYADAFCLSHPDEDHCNGLEKHFWLGRPEDYPDDKKPDGEKRIFIREIWSSPLVFRRAKRKAEGEGLSLCADAEAFWKEARRRVKVNKDKEFKNVARGDRILILGEDENGKTDGLDSILVKVDQDFNRIDWVRHELVMIRLLAPIPADDEETDEALSKNNSSTVLNFKIASDAAHKDACRYLTGGDAEVEIWERLWDRHKDDPACLTYDILLSPHHCSWHSLSRDSWSELREKAKVSDDARSALSQVRDEGHVVAGSAPIKDDDNDPPCIRAKREYEDIVDNVGGEFHCTGEYPNENAPGPMAFEITSEGPVLLSAESTKMVDAKVVKSLLRPAAAAAAAVAAPSLGFPNRPLAPPNKPAGFA